MEFTMFQKPLHNHHARLWTPCTNCHNLVTTLSQPYKVAARLLQPSYFRMGLTKWSCVSSLKQLKHAQQNYLAKTDLDGSIFLRENPVFMSVWVVVIPSGITTTWTDITTTQTDIKTGFSRRNMEPSKSVLAR